MADSEAGFRPAGREPSSPLRPGHQVEGVAAERYIVREAPYYRPVGDEVEVFRAAFEQRIPVLLKGPTGCGKTRFLEYMAWLLGAELRREGGEGLPLITIACHEDLTASDLIGRFLLDEAGTRWLDGPLTRAVRHGGICYLDEIVEARKDTTVVIHSLTDHRRLLPIDKLGVILPAHANFCLVLSYNPGYQGMLKELKPSTRQRFAAIRFAYPDEEAERAIIAHESGLEAALAAPSAGQLAAQLAALGAALRRLGEEHPGVEGPSTRSLVYAGQLIAQGVAPRRACEAALVDAISDDADWQQAAQEVVRAFFA